MTHRLPDQRWQISIPDSATVNQLVQVTGLSPLMAQTLLERGIQSPELAWDYINPELQPLPSPLEEFSDLAISVALLQEAILTGDKIAICGDYDADGMTSTALLLRALKQLGGDVDYAIPSRMKDGYGINLRIVEEFACSDIGIILTVDNGISAYEPIARAVALGMSVIITDHHELPEQLPPAHAILNPKLLKESSPYWGLAGVGVAYILAIATAESLDQSELSHSLLELFTLGTIADLAPLIGVNRRWLRQGLRQLPHSSLAGVQALMQMAGVSEEQKKLKPDDIGFRLGPRINAVGRLADPQIVIDLLTTDDPGLALERAMQCEQINRRRQQLCQQIENEAIALIETTPIDWKEARVLVLVQEGWHHGVIGIVASRLVERYGVPVFIGTDEESDKLRGSARGTREFHVFDALDFCRDLLGKYGGHKAAGGFSLPTCNLAAFKQRLSQFAHHCLQPEQLKPLIVVDAQANFCQLDERLYQEVDSLHPWGIGNEFPVFWTANVRVLEQRIVGKNHLKLLLAQAGTNQNMEALAWRWGEYFPLPNRLDIAYKLQENLWNGKVSLELELVGARLPASRIAQAIFQYQGRSYTCNFWEAVNELKIKNDQGKVLAVSRGQAIGSLSISQNEAVSVDITQPHYCQLIETALAALAKMREG